MQPNKNSYNVLATLSAAGADITFANNKISITGALSFDPDEVVSTGGVVSTVAEVAQVDVITPTAANSTAYSLHLDQTLADGTVVSQTFYYTSDATATATEICNSFRTLINDSAFAITGSGTTTLILTADAGTPVFTANSDASPGVLSIVSDGTGGSTVGVYAVNTYASLVANGAAAADLSVGATYTSWTYEFVSLDASLNINTESSVNSWTVYVEDGITNIAAFTTKLSLLNAAIVNNPLNVQLKDTGVTAAINATAAATAAEVATGYITSTSAAGTTIGLPTGTLLGAQLGATAGTVHELIIDNTAGASVVTIAVSVNGVVSDAGTTTLGSFGDLSIASGVTGIGRFTLMFSSATAFAFTRTA